jgi:hypothetical protein
MKLLTVQIPDNQYPFFIELLNRLGFIDYQAEPAELEDDSDEDIEKNIKQGLTELDLALQGKLKTRPARELLNEL